MKKYVININESKKVIRVDFRDRLTSEDASQFQVEYTERMKNIICKNYELILGAKELTPFYQESIAILQACYELYHSQGFKKIYIVKSTVPKVGDVCNAQLSRIVRKVPGFNPEFIEE